MIDVLSKIIILYPIFLILYFSVCYLVAQYVKRVPDKKIQKVKVRSNIKKDISSSVISLFFAAFFLSLGLHFQAIGIANEGSFTGIAVLDFIIEVIVGLFLFDTVFYWGHRFFHINKTVLKETHLSHHKNNAPTVWGCYNENILGLIIPQSFFAYIVFIIPISMPALIFLNFYAMFLDIVGHSGYDISPRVPFTFFTAVPDHDLHHKYYDCNYAPYFTVWDKIMKTYREYIPSK
jgi:sterol desaturase/sphingolipid hydroxylase (fatty acid hydroxylase superfamily)